MVMMESETAYDIDNCGLGRTKGQLSRSAELSYSQFLSRRLVQNLHGGLRAIDHRRSERAKLGSPAWSMLYIQLAKYPSHYLVLVITEEDFRYALISVEVVRDSVLHDMVMKDIGWLDVRRVHGDEIVVKDHAVSVDPKVGQKRKRDIVESMEHVDIGEQYTPR